LASIGDDVLQARPGSHDLRPTRPAAVRTPLSHQPHHALGCKRQQHGRAMPAALVETQPPARAPDRPKRAPPAGAPLAPLPAAPSGLPGPGWAPALGARGAPPKSRWASGCTPSPRQHVAWPHTGLQLQTRRATAPRFPPCAARLLAPGRRHCSRRPGRSRPLARRGGQAGRGWCDSSRWGATAASPPPRATEDGGGMTHPGRNGAMQPGREPPRSKRARTGFLDQEAHWLQSRCIVNLNFSKKQLS
jgi:hypothetical protein